MQSSNNQAFETRLYRAERKGLKLAILCRTLAVGLAFLWVAGSWLFLEYQPSPWVFFALGGFTVLGILHASVIGTRYDRRWMKYGIYALDVIGICAAFALVPVSYANEVPQIIAFRAYGIYYLFPLVAMAALSLSPWLVLWTGSFIVAGWWGSFLFVISQMDRTLSWADIPVEATRVDYETIFLSVDFIGRGNRVEETGFLFIASAILSLAVWRSRRVFISHVEAQRERNHIAATLGRYVPEEVARRLINNPEALAPQERHAAILVMDVADFTPFASRRTPTAVIEKLNEFLAECADAIAERSGVVIQFSGDGLIAAFGTPIESQSPERDAIEAAYALVDCSETEEFDIRVGLAAGSVASGSIGSSQRQAFTVYGDTVNRAARLESHAKKLKRTILTDSAMLKDHRRNEVEIFKDQKLPGMMMRQDVFALPIRRLP